MLTYDLLEDRRVDDVVNIYMFFVYCVKQRDSMLPCVSSVIDHRRRQNVVRTSVTHSAEKFTDSVTNSGKGLCEYFLFLPHFDIICDLLWAGKKPGWISPAK